jgi:hypothetical protein
MLGSPGQPNTHDRQAAPAEGACLGTRPRRRLLTVRERPLGLPVGLPEVHPPRLAQRGSLGEVLLACSVDSARWQRSIGPYDAPPRHESTVLRHHLSHLARSSDPEVAGDGAVRRDSTGRHAFDCPQDALDVLLPLHCSPTAIPMTVPTGLGPVARGALARRTPGRPRAPLRPAAEPRGQEPLRPRDRVMVRRLTPHQEKALGTRTNTGTAPPPAGRGGDAVFFQVTCSV